MPSPDLASLKAALDKLGFDWEAKDFLYAWNLEAGGRLALVLNAAPALIAELERLRGELDTAGLRIRDLEAQSLDDAAKYGTAIREAKTLGAAERIERIAKDECGYIYEGRERHITAPDLLEIAAELRTELEA